MTSIALVSQTQHLSFLAPALQAALPGASIIAWPQPGWQDAQVAVCWDPPLGALARMPHLRFIHSSGAGVDHIVCDPDLPARPLCRVVDDSVAEGMLEFVLWSVLYFHRRFDEVQAQARQAQWLRPRQARTRQCRIGVLGLGQLGTHVAQGLQQLHFDVAGWSRRPRDLAGVRCYSGDAALQSFLSRTDILVSLLPLTAETQGLLDQRRLRWLPAGAALVHCSRGQHLVLSDLLALVRAGHLRGAVLDVFAQEPVPPEDALWREPGILVTPHMAALAKPETIAAQIVENVQRNAAGLPLLRCVDAAAGY